MSSRRFSVLVISTTKKAVKNLPNAKVAETDQIIAEKGIEVAKAALYPSLSWFGGANTNYSSLFQELVPGSEEFDTRIIGVVDDGSLTPVVTVVPTEFQKVKFFDQLNSNLGFNTGLRLTIPIFNWNSVRHNISRANLAYKNADLSTKLVKNNIYKTILQAYNDAKASAKNYEANNKNIGALERSFDNVKKRYDLGMASMFEYATAKNNLAIAELNAKTAKYDYIFKLKILEFYQGKELNFN